MGLLLALTFSTKFSIASSGNLHIKIALIKPEFTVTAYTQTNGSGNFYNFYTFYAAHKGNATVTGPDLKMLNLSVIHSDWGVSDFTRLFFGTSRPIQAGLVYGVNWFAVTDINVNDGLLFNTNGSRNYDVAIVGFSEYMTARELENFERFVSSGGVVIIMDGGSFSVEVLYYHSTDHVALITGHGWQNYGTNVSASSVFERFYASNQEWKGSNYEQTLFQQFSGATPLNSTVIGMNLTKQDGNHVFSSVQYGEQDYVTNYTATNIVAVWNKTGTILQPQHFIAAYTHRYGKGIVIHFGNYGSVHVMQDTTIQDFLMNSLYYANKYLGYSDAQKLSATSLTPIYVLTIFGGVSMLLKFSVAKKRTAHRIETKQI